MEMNDLFYQHPYDQEFTAKVISCTQYKDGYAIILDDTLFYPEGGGQPGDTGMIDGIRVYDTIRDKDETILHLTKEGVTEGSVVHGVIDWDRRFDHMQNHTGEHLFSGLVHSHHGYNNVGFHMGETIQVDFDGVLEKEDIDRLEMEANAIITSNVPVSVLYPDDNALQDMNYRSKKELDGVVRIVKIDDYDTCACCGTHVRSTGEIGLLKVLSYEKNKSGTRIEMLAGRRAFAYMKHVSDENVAISRMLCAKVDETDAAVERLLAKVNEKEQEVSLWKKQVLDAVVHGTKDGEKLAVVFLKGCDRKDIAHVCDRIVHERNCGCAAVMNDEGNGVMSYVIMSEVISLKAVSRKLNERLSGKGGGRDTVIQGSFQSDAQTIRNVLEELLNGVL